MNIKGTHTGRQRSPWKSLQRKKQSTQPILELQNCSINMAIVKFIAVTVLTIFAIINSARAVIPFFGHDPGAKFISNKDNSETRPIKLLYGDLCMYRQRYGAYAVRYTIHNNNCCEQRIASKLASDAKIKIYNYS